MLPKTSSSEGDLNGRLPWLLWRLNFPGIIKYKYLVFVPGSWHGASKIVGIPSDKSVDYMLTR